MPSGGVERDLRLDFFRGLALFSIFVDHVPNNLVAQFTLQSAMFSDAAEVFMEQDRDDRTGRLLDR